MTPENVEFRGTEDGQQLVWLQKGDSCHHTLLLGQTRRGKSAVIEAEALRRGISCEELLKELEPTEAQKEATRVREQAEQERVAHRLAAIREAYWQASSESDFYRLHDALVSTVMVGSGSGPTQDQIRALFSMLPAQIIGQGIAWGFGDTEVGDDIYTFIEGNREAVIERLGLR